MRVFIEAEAPRVTCAEHGVTVAAVLWARHGAGHTRAFDDQVAWLVTHASKSAVVELMRVAWRTVGAIASRVVADARAVQDPFDGLVRIGIDEISYRRGHQYLMVVVDHDTGRLVWAAAGHDRATLQKFFDLLGAERASRIKLISADAAEWIGDVALAACENATLCLDPFHIVRWGSQALDVVRRWVWNLLRRMDLPGHAKQLKNCRYALWKNPEDLTARQAAKLAWIARHNHRLYRAYLLKEQLTPRVRPPRGGGRRHARRLARMGKALSDPGVRRALPPDQEAPCRDHRRRHPRPLERAHRERQHQAAAAHPHRLRVPLHRQPHRPVPPRPRRPLPTPTRQTDRRMTHGSVRRARCPG